MIKHDHVEIGLKMIEQIRSCIWLKVEQFRNSIHLKKLIS